MYCNKAFQCFRIPDFFLVVFSFSEFNITESKWQGASASSLQAQEGDSSSHPHQVDYVLQLLVQRQPFGVEWSSEKLRFYFSSQVCMVPYCCFRHVGFKNGILACTRLFDLSFLKGKLTMSNVHPPRNVRACPGALPIRSLRHFIFRTFVVCWSKETTKKWKERWRQRGRRRIGEFQRSVLLKWSM